MGLFSAALRAELSKGASIDGVKLPGEPQVHPVLEIELPPALPGGSTRLRRYASAGVASDTFGPVYHEHVIEGGWGGLPRSVDIRGSNLQGTETTVVISDTDRSFANEVARYRRSLRTSAATIRLVSPNVDDADAFVAFSGILDSWAQTSEMNWELHLRPDDFPLQYGVAPKCAITRQDWPNSRDDVVGTFIPIIYGIHDSTGVSGAGMLPAYYVDMVNFRYLVGLGVMKAVRAVYVDGAVASTSDYAVTNIIVNGKTLTMIDFTSDQGDEAVVTVDVEGLTEDGTTSGDLLLNPAEQKAHFLANFVWNDWRHGDFHDPADEPIDTASFDAVGDDFLNDMGHEGSRWIGGASQVRALEEIQTFLASEGLHAFWKNNGSLALMVNDHRTTDIYPSDPVFVLDYDLVEGFSNQYITEATAREVTLQFVWAEVLGKYHQTLRVQDLSVHDPVAVARALQWSASRVV